MQLKPTPVSERVDKRGRRFVTFEIPPGSDAKVLIVSDASFYKLGQPVEDIVGGHVICNAVRVYWCSAEQAWVGA